MNIKIQKALAAAKSALDEVAEISTARIDAVKAQLKSAHSNLSAELSALEAGQKAAAEERAKKVADAQKVLDEEKTKGATGK